MEDINILEQNNYQYNENDFKNVGVSVQMFLETRRSEQTAKNYKFWINDFFKYLFKKGYDFVTKEELESINNRMVESYRMYLLKVKNNSANSINSKVGCLVKLFKYLEKQEYDINPYKLQPSDNLQVDENPYDPFSYDEIKMMIEKAKEYKNGESKSLLIEVAVRTGIRKSALLSLTKDSFKLTQKGWNILVTDKGNRKVEQPIPQGFYEDKIKPRLDSMDERERFFSFSPRTVDYLIENLKNDLNIQGNKVFHSFKKTHINRVGEINGRDIAIMQMAGKHKNASTTLNYYYKDVDMEDKYRATVELFDGVDLTIIDNMDAKTLRRVIKQCTLGTHIEIINKYKKIKGEK